MAAANISSQVSVVNGPVSGGQSRRWAFTLNNYTESHCGILEDAFTQKKVSYVIFAKETGASGTPHLQGYLELEKKKTLGGLKTLLGITTIHLSIAKGSAAENMTYCSKENPPAVFGTPMKQGNRTDLDQVKEMLKSGAPMLEVAELDFTNYVRYKRGFEGYQKLVQESVTFDPPKVYVHWGVAGAGKTRKVYDTHPLESIWAWGGGQWFDGYDLHEVALFDDFDGSDISYRLLLRVLDRYPIRVPVKGGFVAWRPKVIYLTSNLSPQEWYNLADNSALLRRLTTVTHFSGIQ
jgi:hypothetical protein